MVFCYMTISLSFGALFLFAKKYMAVEVKVMMVADIFTPLSGA